ncbi:hypothetical protein [Collimonas antrihumi]|uniref:hypothetical protein n=1 Tax=Collimonas antrihumi TaxID=1940615 RepID=UPI001B8BB198|nr:hypothetical protein [Collimonas antrihumi]
MATNKRTPSATSQDRPPTEPADIVTPNLGGSGADYLSFIWQQLAEIHRMNGELKAQNEALKDFAKSNHDSLKNSLDNIKTKVDDLVNWKQKILGGVVVLGTVFTLLGFVIAKGWDYVSFKIPAPAVIAIPSAPPN